MSDQIAKEEMTSESTETNNRRNFIVLGALVLAALLLGGGYLFWARDRANDELADRQERALESVRAFEESRPEATGVPRATPEPEELGPPQPVAEVGEVLFVNRVPGDDYGRMGIRHADGSRTLLERTCLRLHYANGTGVCLSENDGPIPTYRTTFFDADSPQQTDVKSYPSALPSRARISYDGSLSAVTAFVSGTSYADVGGGETQTIVTIDDVHGSKPLRGANQFVVDDPDPRYGNLEAQYWGLTFRDVDDFYITGFYDDQPEIMKGSLDVLTVTPTGWIGSCPSLSPDGKTLVFKELRDDGGFDLVAANTETNETWRLNESRSVDDQVEWLDNDTILYALHPDGGDTPVQPEFDIWVLDIAEGSTPELFLPNADSPATVRAPVQG